ncbi:Phage terminase, endonuclease small subunit M [Escherichia coli]|nr:Phage terminase, endonuclease small subunit M [Escherichia coli]
MQGVRLCRRGLTDADSMASSLKLLREAMHLNPNAGVKREIATLSRALKKADSAGRTRRCQHTAGAGRKQQK